MLETEVRFPVSIVMFQIFIGIALAGKTVREKNHCGHKLEDSSSIELFRYNKMILTI